MSGDEKYLTEIFVPELAYPGKSYEVSVSENIDWRVSEENERVIVLRAKSGMKREMATLGIRRKTGRKIKP